MIQRLRCRRRGRDGTAVRNLDAHPAADENEKREQPQRADVIAWTQTKTRHVELLDNRNVYLTIPAPRPRASWASVRTSTGLTTVLDTANARNARPNVSRSAAFPSKTRPAPSLEIEVSHAWGGMPFAISVSWRAWKSPDAAMSRTCVSTATSSATRA